MNPMYFLASTSSPHTKYLERDSIIEILHEPGSLEEQKKINRRKRGQGCFEKYQAIPHRKIATFTD
jgi:hypothetical protein